MPELERGAIFPTLDGAQIARIARIADERSFSDGENLWNQGDRDPSFFVVLDGRVEILSGRDHLVTVHEPGGFTGDVDLLSGREVVVRARASGATKTLALCAKRLRSLVQTDAELGEIFLRAFLLRRLELMQQGRGNVTLVGSRHCRGTLAIQEFLTRNSQPFAYLDVERDPDVQTTLDAFAIGVDDIPVVICRGEKVLRKPTIEETAECLGLNRLNRDTVRDVVVIGAGPAGLAAAVYAASEGLDALVLEASAPGGQAGSSSRIENYLGFPTGISGQLLASNALVQAEKFGAELAVARTAVRLHCDAKPFRVEYGGGAEVRARAVIVATGVRYRKPEIEDLSRFEGLGVYYGATQVEANYCRGEEVVVVGGGNSAGQAAVFLAGIVRHVHLLVRGEGLSESMSRYLIRRIEETANITLRTRTRIEALEGETSLERVRWRDDATGERTVAPLRHVFLMTGATPNTAWTPGCFALDPKGFIVTGPDLRPEDLAASSWPLSRPPMLFETSTPGVFAVGDVRSGSTKRVAAAVGEGSVCVQLVHRYLAS